VCKIKLISDYLHRDQRTRVVNQSQGWGRGEWAQIGQVSSPENGNFYRPGVGEAKTMKLF
jgi:hypothetical protein